MTPKQLALYTLFLILGISVGGLVVNLAYKPLFVAQAIEIYQMEEDNRQLQHRYSLMKVDIEALRQEVKDMSVLKQLGIIIK